LGPGGGAKTGIEVETHSMDTAHRSRLVTRRRLLGSGFAALAGGTLAACGLPDLPGGAPAPAQHVAGTLDVWGHAMFPFDQDVGADVVRQLQDRQPGLQVKFAPTNDADGMKLRVAAAGGTPPDLVTVNGIEVQGLALEGVTTSVESYLKASRVIKKADIWAPFVQDVTWKGAMFGMPYGPDLRILYVNQDRYARAGLDASKPPKTWAEVQQNVAKTVERDGAAISVLGFDPFIGSGLFNLWLVPFWQMGGELLGQDGTKVTIVGEKSLGAWQWIKQMIDQQGGWPAVTAFRQGRMPQQIFADGYMSHFYGTNSERSEQFNRIAPGLKFGVGTFPLPPNGRRTSFGGLWTWVIPKESRLRDGSWLFLEEALSEENNLKFADRYDRVPVRQSVTQSEKYLKSDPFRKLVAEEVPGRKWLITAPGANGMRADIMAVATDILDKGVSISEALNKAQTSIQLKLDDALRAAR
jgi:ABC-type glycerol-3-phosphate transport system substrate-binding protein